MPKQLPDAEAQHSSTRRNFIKLVGISALGLPLASFINFSAENVSVVTDVADKVATSSPAQWATNELIKAFKQRNIAVQQCKTISEAKAGNLCIVASGSNSALAKGLLKTFNKTIPAVPEALGLVHGTSQNKAVLLASGFDERGLVYALLELTDRVNNASSPLTDLRVFKNTIEQPANKVRSLNRLFVSDVEDKVWYNDRKMWPEYLTMLATQRFNQFNLSLGIGYDFLTEVTDAYFVFSYPYFLSVPGYNVRVPQLPDAERDQNLAMLKYISEQTVARGLEFKLGIWVHAYEWQNSPNPKQTITGLNASNHPQYCRDALRMLLQECPAISGITFRVHGESGITEGNYDLWKIIFDGIKTCGRVVSIDMHSKGVNQEMIDTALTVGVPVTVSPKYWAEHMGMPYHQADIRSLEIPKPSGKPSMNLMNLSTGTRSFTRYGYGDFLKTDKNYDVIYRIWPGTQRILLWGDPVTGAAQSRMFSFCGASGADLMEPLSFKGRRGSGIPGDRCAYADATLKPQWDWEKYLYSLRVFGRTMYNPDTDPDVWNRYLRNQFGAGATDTQQALASATRILPTVLTAHGASAGNNVFWPEIYTNMPITNTGIKNIYSDTPQPKTFGKVTPMDPQLFLGIDEYITELLKGENSGKYTPVEVAQWLFNHADNATKHLAQSQIKSTRKNRPEFRRMAVDVAIQANLGMFFSHKFKAGALFNIFEQTGSKDALENALTEYKTARNFWAKAADTAKDVYKNDITAGEHPYLRGHWLDRLPAIDEDIDHMAAMLTKVSSSTQSGQAKMAISKILNKPQRLQVQCRHKSPATFTPGKNIDLEIAFEKAPQFTRLYYRHVNHGERYKMAELKESGNKYTFIIPADYTTAPYHIAYYFEVNESRENATLYPGFDGELKNQPYFVIHQV